MNSFGRKLVRAGFALILAGTAGIAVSHVRGQSPDNDLYALPPSPTDVTPPTIGTSPPSVAIPTNVPAAATPPYGYSRFRPTQLRQRPTLPSAPSYVAPAQPTAANTTAQGSNRSAVKPAVATQPGWPSSTKAAGQLPPRSDIKTVSHLESVPDPLDPPIIPPIEPRVRQPLFNRQHSQSQLPMGMTFPTDRATAPAIRGSHLKLRPDETATERTMQLMQIIDDLERQIDGLSQQNSDLNEIVKHRDDQMMVVIREVKSARNDVATAKSELERLRSLVQSLQEKVVATERDNAALLQTMAPLLYQMLNADGASSGKSEE